MKKLVPNIIGVLLGLCFLLASVPLLLHLAPIPNLPEGTPSYHFMAALGPTGYLTFVKVCELMGGLLVMIPRFRNIGLLILGPIIVNIIANGVFIDYPKGLLNPLVPAVAFLALFLLWTARAKFAALLN